MNLRKVHISCAWLACAVPIVAMEANADTLIVANLFEPTFSDGRIEKVQTDGTGRLVLRDVGGGLRGVAVDVDGEYLFWSNVDTDRIERVPVGNPGAGPVGIVTSGLDFPQSIAISASVGKLFWADAGFNHVASSNLDGSGQAVLVSASTTAIGVDDVNQKIYTEDRVTAALGSILRFNFDGSDLETVINDVPPARAIAIDPVHEYVFWTSSAGLSDGNGGVYRVNFDGTDFRELFVMGSNLDSGGLVLDIENEHVYWAQETSELNRDDIFRMGLDGSSPEVISTGFGSISAMVLVPDSEFQIAVAIDIKPGNDKNVMNPQAQGHIWVAVLADSGAGFDPLQIDITTARFGPNEAEATKYKVRDVNQDGMDDLLMRFRTPEAGIASGDTAASLTGMTVHGQLFTGTDGIRTVGGGH